jgi:hypothetical protein
MDPRLANIVIVVGLVAGTANFVAQFVVDGYKPDQSINLIFMAIVGSAVAFKRNGKGRNNDRNGDRDERGERP